MIDTPQKLGWLRSPPSRIKNLFKPALTTKLPDEFHLDWFPYPLQQGQLGSCVANAVAQAVHFDQIKTHIDAFTFSRLFAYYNARARYGWELSDTGCYIADAVQDLFDIGYIPESRYPYDTNMFTNRPPQELYDEAVKFKALSSRRVSHDLNDIKGAIVEGYPVTIGFTVHGNFGWYGNGDIEMPSGPIIGGHAINLVGFKDSTERVNFVTSWGMWGTNGRGTLPYAYLSPEHADDFHVISSISQPE